MTNYLENTEVIRERNKRLLTGIRNLPSVPFIMVEVSKMLDNPRTGASDLGKLISKDQAMVAKILSVANSPLYGLPRRVSTIEFAIVILGFDHIKNIVIALSMMEAFKSKEDKNWNRRAFWLHSLITASAAKRIADDLGYRKSGEAFTCGLLHDLGISVIQRYFFEGFKEICALVNDQQMRYTNAEQKVLGISHEEIGKFLIEKWNLPSSLGDAILFHHKPSEAENEREMAAIIHLADYMTQRFTMGDLNWDENYELDLAIIDILNLGDESYLESFIQSYEQLFRVQIDSIKF
ncbi:MAG: HDOD domain-containing protein [Ignavibacteriales bacterium]|nr:HDOD domain-containing protein [Ignavibacteriales bacterium]